jgi:hypothetical protein
MPNGQKASWLALALVATVAALPAWSAEGPATEPVLEQLERLSGMGQGDDPVPLLEAVSDGIAADPRRLLEPLLRKIRDGKLSDTSLAMHVWALGLTRDPAAVDPLIALHRATGSPAVQRSCRQALATIGGERAGQVLVAALDGTQQAEMRFEILALLAQMQHPEAPARAGELLAVDPQRYFWQPVLVFGAMGDQGVPYLLSRMADPDRQVRMNAIQVLGLWLLASEAAPRITAAYGNEEDVEVREVMLNAMQLAVTDLAAVRRFFREVEKAERDERLVAFARQTLGAIGALAAEAEQFARQPPQAPRPFQDVWDELYRSAGRKGDYPALSAASRPEHEGRLKALRQRILHRHSEEALADYQRVNRIILRTRMVAAAHP